MCLTTFGAKETFDVSAEADDVDGPMDGRRPNATTQQLWLSMKQHRDRVVVVVVVVVVDRDRRLALLVSSSAHLRSNVWFSAKVKTHHL